MPSHRDTKLDSWKAIGVFLGHDVSTARRWEKESGLPVHRVPGNKRHAVYAYTRELDAWLRGPGEPRMLQDTLHREHFLPASAVNSMTRPAGIKTRPALPTDLARLTEIYNHYVVHTPVTFDLEPYSVEHRAAWFDRFSHSGRYRLIVAEEDEIVLGYAGTMRFRPKAAYDTTVETTIYCAPEAVGKGVGSRLYSALFEAISGEDIHRIVAGYTLPNPASAALHERFGFKLVGVFGEVGRKFGRYWDVAWTERPLRLAARRSADH